MQSWKVFAILYALGNAGYAVAAKLTGGRISPLLGVFVMTVSALAVGMLILLWYRIYEGELTYTKYGLVAAAIAGVAVAISDLAIFFMYNRGAQLSIAGILSEVASVAVIALVGILVLREPLTLTKILGITFSAIGIILLFEGA